MESSENKPAISFVGHSSTETLYLTSNSLDQSTPIDRTRPLVSQHQYLPTKDIIITSKKCMRMHFLGIFETNSLVCNRTQQRANDGSRITWYPCAQASKAYQDRLVTCLFTKFHSHSYSMAYLAAGGVLSVKTSLDGLRNGKII